MGFTRWQSLASLLRATLRLSLADGKLPRRHRVPRMSA